MPEEVTKIKENAQKLKQLASLTHSDEMLNNETKVSIKEAEDCVVCRIDAIPLVPCNSHDVHHVTNGTCVLAVETRNIAKKWCWMRYKGKEEIMKVSEEGFPKSYTHTSLANMRIIKIGERRPTQSKMREANNLL